MTQHAVLVVHTFVASRTAPCRVGGFTTKDVPPPAYSTNGTSLCHESHPSGDPFVRIQVRGLKCGLGRPIRTRVLGDITHELTFTSDFHNNFLYRSLRLWDEPSLRLTLASLWLIPRRLENPQTKGWCASHKWGGPNTRGEDPSSGVYQFYEYFQSPQRIC